MNSLIALVDLDDKITGYETKAEVHRRGLLHRAFSVFIVKDGKMLIQKRNIDKYHSGGLWSNTCCSHQQKGEELTESVHRRMSEEMGFISAVTIAIAIATLFIYARSVTTRSRSTFYSISACCAAGLFVIQMSLNVFGATDILPLTGVTFPFISAGGSSIISCWGLLAFIKAADERTYAK